MATAVILTTDGLMTVEQYEDGKSYDFIKNGVGGWIECVHLANLGGVDMWVNEEGKLDGLPVNPIATLAWIRDYGMTDVIVGNVVFTGGADEEGETLGLNDEQLANIKNLLLAA